MLSQSTQFRRFIPVEILSLQESEMEALFDSVDTNNDGVIDKAEYASWRARQAKTAEETSPKPQTQGVLENWRSAEATGVGSSQPSFREVSLQRLEKLSQRGSDHHAGDLSCYSIS